MHLVRSKPPFGGLEVNPQLMRSETKKGEEKMNKEKLQEIHSKRFLGDRFKEVNFEGQNSIQFFLDENDPLNKGDQVSGKCFTNKSINHRWN